jgi:hypothetical protein
VLVQAYIDGLHTHIREHLNLLQITTYREAMQKALLFDSSTPSHRQSYNDRDDSRNSVRFIRTNKNFNYHGSNHRFQNQNGNGNGNGNSNANANTNQNQKSSQKPFENSMVNSSSDTELEESTNGCNHCQRNGHTDEECWKKFPDLKPKKSERYNNQSDSSKSRPQNSSILTIATQNREPSHSSNGNSDRKNLHHYDEFEIKINGHNTKAIIDSGALDTVIPTLFVQKYNIPIKNKNRAYTVADDKTRNDGMTTNLVEISVFNSTTPMEVMVLPRSNVLLGLDWLNFNKAYLDSSDQKIVFKQKSFSIVSNSTFNELNSVLAIKSSENIPTKSLEKIEAKPCDFKTSPVELTTNKNSHNLLDEKTINYANQSFIKQNNEELEPCKDSKFHMEIINKVKLVDISVLQLTSFMQVIVKPQPIILIGLDGLDLKEALVDNNPAENSRNNREVKVRITEKFIESDNIVIDSTNKSDTHIKLCSPTYKSPDIFSGKLLDGDGLTCFKINSINKTCLVIPENTITDNTRITIANFTNSVKDEYKTKWLTKEPFSALKNNSLRSNHENMKSCKSKTLHGSNLLTEENDSNSSTQKQIQTSIKTPEILKFENLYNNKSEARSYDSLNYSLNTLFKIILIALVYNPAMDIKLDRRSRLTSDLSTKKKANGFNGNNYNYDMMKSSFITDENFLNYQDHFPTRLVNVMLNMQCYMSKYKLSNGTGGSIQL